MTKCIPTVEVLRRRERRFLYALLVAMLMATGPGVLLVNRPETLLGFPIIYLWGVGWFFVIGIIAWLTDRHVWRHDAELEEGNDAC